jgi:hypothetical protein
VVEQTIRQLPQSTFVNMLEDLEVFVGPLVLVKCIFSMEASRSGSHAFEDRLHSHAAAESTGRGPGLTSTSSARSGQIRG